MSKTKNYLMSQYGQEDGFVMDDEILDVDYEYYKYMQAKDTHIPKEPQLMILPVVKGFKPSLHKKVLDYILSGKLLRFFLLAYIALVLGIIVNVALGWWL